MSISKKVVHAMAAVLCAAAIAGGSAIAQGTAAYAATGASPYNITVGIGGSASEVRFTWQSNSLSAGQLQIAKSSDVKNGSFPSNSTKQATTEKVTATEGVLDNPKNTDHAVSSFKDANGAALGDEYSNKVTVGGLAPDTSYTYRVSDGTTWSQPYTFRTRSASVGFSFVAVGDPQIGAGSIGTDISGWAKTLGKITSKLPNAHFLFSLGDQVNNYDHLYTQQAEYDGFFNPESSNYLQTHILAAFSGNHDFQMGKYYSFHYSQPNLSTLGQTQTNGVPDSNGDYWFRYGNTLFMNLEANNFYDISAHDAFLKQAIAANPNIKWKVAAYHQAPYSEANHDGATSSDDDIMFMRKNWTKLMDKYDIDVVLNGHDHYYTRSYQMYGGSPVSTTKTHAVTNPKGTVYFTLDSGSGSKYYKYNTTADHSFSSFGWQNNVPTYSNIAVTDKTFAVTTYSVNSDTPIDTYTITKSASAAALAAGNGAGTASNPKTGDNGGGLYAILAVAAGALLIAAFSAVMVLRKKSARG